jgi:hypothetical protein
MEPHPGGRISTVTTRGIRRRRWKVEFFLSALIFCFNPVEMEIVVGQLMPWMGVADGSYHATVRDRNLFARRHLLFLCQTQQFGHKLNQTRCTVVDRTRRHKWVANFSEAFHLRWARQRGGHRFSVLLPPSL